jgi:hypothetical protein
VAENGYSLFELVDSLIYRMHYAAVTIIL